MSAEEYAEKWRSFIAVDDFDMEDLVKALDEYANMKLQEAVYMAEGIVYYGFDQPNPSEGDKQQKRAAAEIARRIRTLKVK